MRKRSKKVVTLPERFVPQFWQEADGRCAAIKEIRRRYEVLKDDVQADKDKIDNAQGDGRLTSTFQLAVLSPN